MARRSREEELAYGRDKELARFRLAKRQLDTTLQRSQELTKDVRQRAADLRSSSRKRSHESEPPDESGN